MDKDNREFKVKDRSRQKQSDDGVDDSNICTGKTVNRASTWRNREMWHHCLWMKAWLIHLWHSLLVGRAGHLLGGVGCTSSAYRGCGRCWWSRGLRRSAGVRRGRPGGLFVGGGRRGRLVGGGRRSPWTWSSGSGASCACWRRRSTLRKCGQMSPLVWVGVACCLETNRSLIMCLRPSESCPRKFPSIKISWALFILSIDVLKFEISISYPLCTILVQLFFTLWILTTNNADNKMYSSSDRLKTFATVFFCKKICREQWCIIFCQSPIEKKSKWRAYFDKYRLYLSNRKPA